MIRMTALFFFSTFTWSGFAQGLDYQKLADRIETISSGIISNVSADGALPSYLSQPASASGAPLFDISPLMAARPQSFAPKDFQPLIKLGEKANEVTRLYMNGGTKPADSLETMKNQERYQNEISQSAVFSIHALGNVAQGLTAFLSQLPVEEQQEPKRMRGKIIVNKSIFQQFAAISSMALVSGMSEENRIAMIDALASNLPLFSQIVTDDTLGDIYTNFRIRLLQLPNGSGVKQKLSALQDQVATLRDDASRKEILTN